MKPELQDKKDLYDVAKVEAEIAKLMAETARINRDFEASKARDFTKVEAEITKLNAETAKIQREQRFYPAVVIGAFVGALVTAFGAVIKLFP